MLIFQATNTQSPFFGLIQGFCLDPFLLSTKRVLTIIEMFIPGSLQCHPLEGFFGYFVSAPNINCIAGSKKVLECCRKMSGKSKNLQTVKHRPHLCVCVCVCVAQRSTSHCSEAVHHAFWCRVSESLTDLGLTNDCPSNPIVLLVSASPKTGMIASPCQHT